MINYQDSLFDNMEKLAEKEANEIEDWTQEIIDTTDRLDNMPNISLPADPRKYKS